MKLRPHHLLCTLAYEGKGYSEEFTTYMDAIAHRLRTDENIIVKLVLSTDAVCLHCPKRQGPGRCLENRTVTEYDRKVFEAFHLKEASYVYRDLIREIRKKLTPAIVEDICGTCSWYPTCSIIYQSLGY